MKLVKTIAVLAAISLFSAAWAEGEVFWIGPNTDKSWNDDGTNWSSGKIPGSDDTVVFTNSNQQLKIKTGNAASNVVVRAGASIEFQRTNSEGSKALSVKEMNGDGEVKLLATGIAANYASFNSCTVSVGSIVVSQHNDPSWFDGGNAEGRRLVVNSPVSGSGKLELRGNVTLAGETTLTGSLKLSSNSVVQNLIYNDENVLTEDSSGWIDCLTVQSGVFDMSQLPENVKVGLVVFGGSAFLNGGTLTIGSDYSGTIEVGTYGGFIKLNGEYDATPTLPTGLAFAEGADLRRIIVWANVNGQDVAYSISKEGNSYVLTDNVCVWTGAAADGLFATPGNWSGNIAPQSGKVTLFTNSVGTVYFYLHNTSETASVKSVIVSKGANVTFMSHDNAGGGKTMLLDNGVFGAGTLCLKRFGFKPNALNVEIAVAKLLLQAHNSEWKDRPCWLEAAENYPLFVSSDISSDVKSFKIRRNVTFSGDNSGFTGWVQIEEAGTVTFAKAASVFSHATELAFDKDNTTILLDFTDGPAVLGGTLNFNNHMPTISQRVFVTDDGGDVSCSVAGLTLSNAGECDLSGFTLALANPEDLPAPAVMRRTSLTLLSVPNGTLSGDVNVTGAPFKTAGEPGRWAAVKGETTVCLTAGVPGLILVFR